MKRKHTSFVATRSNNDDQEELRTRPQTPQEASTNSDDHNGNIETPPRNSDSMENLDGNSISKNPPVHEPRRTKSEKSCLSDSDAELWGVYDSSELSDQELVQTKRCNDCSLASDSSSDDKEVKLIVREGVAQNSTHGYFDTANFFTLIYSEDYEEALARLPKILLKSTLAYENVMGCTHGGYTSLMAIMTESDDGILSESAKILFVRLIELGGKHLVWTLQESIEQTILHHLCSKNNLCREVFDRVIEVGGSKHFVQQRDTEGRTALHLACKLSARSLRLEVVNRLIEFGEDDLVMSSDHDGKTALHYACETMGEEGIEIIDRLIEVGKLELIMMVDHWGKTALHCAFTGIEIENIEIIKRLIEVGGLELVKMSDCFSKTVLHNACIGQFEFTNQLKFLEVIDELLACGGEDLVKMTNIQEESSLHLACQNIANGNTPKLVKKLLTVGGVDLALMMCRKGATALHAVCATPHPTSIYWLEVINELIAVGGKDLVLMCTPFDFTGLHLVITQNDLYHSTKGTWVEIMHRLLEVGGRDLVLMTDCKARTALHCACAKISTDLETFLLLIEVGREELISMTTENGHRAIELEFMKQRPCEEVISRLIEVSEEKFSSSNHEQFFGRLQRE